ncbi:MAG: response regulator [Spirochaetales bacterium]|nr:response regulator [Spirochaetales bacterium]MCF7937514.1 response regulator [Spirochaetales bacterium]
MARILIIDDDEQVRRMFELMLQDAGYEVDTAKDGVEGMQIFEKDSYDVVILDIIMPEQEGIETFRKMRSVQKNVKVIAVSGGGKAGPESYLPMAKSFGARFTFEKPVDRKELLNAVHALVEEG